LDVITASPMREEEDEDSGRGSGGNSDSDKENHDAPASKKFLEEGSILKRLLVNTSDPAKPEWMAATATTTSPKEVASQRPLLIAQRRVSVTFCNMRQNILDRRKKRGRKRSQDTPRSSTESRAVVIASEDEYEDDVDDEDDLEAVAEKRLVLGTPLPCISELEEQLSPKEVEDECISITGDEEEEEISKIVLNPILRSYLEKPPLTATATNQKIDDPVATKTTAISECSNVAPKLVDDVDPLRMSPVEYNSPNMLNTDTEDSINSSSKRVEKVEVEDVILGEDVKENISSSISKASSTIEPIILSKSSSGDSSYAIRRDGSLDRLSYNPFSSDDDIEEEIAYDNDAVSEWGTISVASSDFSISSGRATTTAAIAACSISVVDLFRDSPLASLLCYGCSRPYGGSNEFSVNLRCQTMTIVCCHCSWWAERKIDARDCKYKSKLEKEQTQ
jgi:hypothetical protein